MVDSMEREIRLQALLANADFSERCKDIVGLARHGSLGQFVMAGPGPAPAAHKVGHILQIRIGQGAFGTDLYLIRHCDGTYQQHASNVYLPMNDSEVDQVRDLFAGLMPEDEDYSAGYVLADDPSTHATGFMIEVPVGFKPLWPIVRGSMPPQLVART